MKDAREERADHFRFPSTPKLTHCFGSPAARGEAAGGRGDAAGGGGGGCLGLHDVIVFIITRSESRMQIRGRGWKKKPGRMAPRGGPD